MAVDRVPTEWSRRRLMIMMAAVLIFASVIVAGLALTIVKIVGSPESGTPTARVDWPVLANGTRGAEYRDALAAEPMIASDRQDMQPAPPALKEAAPLIVDAAASTGPADVPSGFSHTPEGAAAQLSAIVISALEPMSVDHARDVYREWAADGAVFERWPITESIQAFHQAAGTVDGDGSVVVSASPVGGQIKGEDGPDWVLACVQLDVTAAVVEQTRFGFGHCERMQWDGVRWAIAAGRPPAQAPSTWPRSQRSADAGWHPWLESDVPE
jgi:hypothetical protein